MGKSTGRRKSATAQVELISGGTGKISINGRKKVDTLEREFQDVFGLYIQVYWWCSYKENELKDKWSQLSKDSGDDYSLSKLNRLATAFRKPKKDW